MANEVGLSVREPGAPGALILAGAAPVPEPRAASLGGCAILVLVILQWRVRRP